MANLTSLLEKNELCLKTSQLQNSLLVASITYLSIGSGLLLVNIVVNLMVIFFVCANKKARRSPICIFMSFLAGANLLRSCDFVLITLGKTGRIKVNQNFEHHENEVFSNYLCGWTSFLPNFSGHIAIYIALNLQLQRLIALKTNTDFNLLLYNDALAYFTSIAIIFFFIVIDEFPLYDNFFLNHVIYCPLTLMYTCVTNTNFKLLNTLKFNTMLYHHIHTFFYNVLPNIISATLNLLIFYYIKKRKYRSKKRHQIGSHSQSGQTESIKKRNQEHTLEIALKYKLPIIRKKSSVASLRKEGIFLEFTDITNTSICMSFALTLFTIPNNLLSYFAEWNSNFLPAVYNHLNMNLKIGSVEIEVNRVLGNAKIETQVMIQLFYLTSDLIDFMNFTVFLCYQIFSCRTLKKEFGLFYRNLFKRKTNRNFRWKRPIQNQSITETQF